MIATLREEGRRLGLAAVGIAPAIDEVRRQFGWARSVVCAAISYLPPEVAVEKPLQQPAGLIARLARGADYHTVLRDKLDLLAGVIRQQPNARLEICVDTRPLPERKLALLAGIGWRGKNSCVYVEGCGSWVSLGEIVTDIALQDGAETPQLEDRCGDCTRCVELCPAGAITAAHHIDRSRCLSALTLATEPISDVLRRTMGNRVYGCDVCQEVCPQNAGVRPKTPEFAVDRFPGARPELIPLITMSARDYRERVKESPIGWIRRTRIRRSAAIAAGNLRSHECLPALKEMLADENPILREAAEWAIKEIEADMSKKQ